MKSILVLFLSTIAYSSSFSQATIKRKVSEVKITGKKKKVEDINKKVYKPTQMLGGQNLSAKEVLNAIPSVNVDNENGVSFRNDGNVTIMINGKISNMSGENIQQIPANAIEKIEVISVPNAKYNSEGSAGIINIVLKKSKNSYNGGYISGYVGNNDKYNIQAGSNFNAGKFGFITNLGYSYLNFDRSGFSKRLYKENIERHKYDHSNTGANLDKIISGMVGVDYNIDSNNVLSLMTNFSYNWRSAYHNDYDTFLDNTFDTFSKWHFYNQEENPNLRYNIDLSFNHLMPNKDKWTTSFNILDNRNMNKVNQYRLDYDIFEYGTNNPKDSYIVSNEQVRNIISIQTDYEMTLNSKNKIETGLRWAYRNYRYSTDYIEDPFNNTIRNEYTNDFRFREYVSSMYGVWNSQISEKWSSSLGLRLEQTNSKSTDFNDSLVLDEYDYFNAFPSVNIQYHISKKGGKLTASYSERINRPNPGMLNPIQYVGDPVAKLFGEPSVRPEYIHSIELNYENDFNRKFTYNTSLYNKVSNNSITRYLKPQADGTFEVKVENIGELIFTGWEFNVNYKPSRKLKFSLNSNLSYNQLFYSDGVTDYNSNYVNWQSRGMLNYKLPFGIESQIIAFYRSPFRTPQGRINFNSSIDLTLRKKILDQKGQIILSVFDIFNDKKFHVKASDIDFNNEFYRKRESRYFTIGFRYSFGSERKAPKSKRMPNDD